MIRGLQGALADEQARSAEFATLLNETSADLSAANATIQRLEAELAEAKRLEMPGDLELRMNIADNAVWIVAKRIYADGTVYTDWKCSQWWDSQAPCEMLITFADGFPFARQPR